MRQQLPAALKQHLREANIIDNELASVSAKLQERVSANIISYLQLVLLQFQRTKNVSSEQERKMQAYAGRTEFTTLLDERATGMHN